MKIQLIPPKPAHLSHHTLSFSFILFPYSFILQPLNSTLSFPFSSFFSFLIWFFFYIKDSPLQTENLKRLLQQTLPSINSPCQDHTALPGENHTHTQSQLAEKTAQLRLLIKCKADCSCLASKMIQLNTLSSGSLYSAWAQSVCYCVHCKQI